MESKSFKVSVMNPSLPLGVLGAKSLLSEASVEEISLFRISWFFWYDIIDFGVFLNGGVGFLILSDLVCHKFT